MKHWILSLSLVLLGGATTTDAKGPPPPGTGSCQGSATPKGWSGCCPVGGSSKAKTWFTYSCRYNEAGHPWFTCESGEPGSCNPKPSTANGSCDDFIQIGSQDACLDDELAVRDLAGQLHELDLLDGVVCHDGACEPTAGHPWCAADDSGESCDGDIVCCILTILDGYCGCLEGEEDKPLPDSADVFEIDEDVAYWGCSQPKDLPAPSTGCEVKCWNPSLSKGGYKRAYTTLTCHPSELTCSDGTANVFCS